MRLRFSASVSDPRQITVLRHSRPTFKIERKEERPKLRGEDPSSAEADFPLWSIGRLFSTTADPSSCSGSLPAVWWHRRQQHTDSGPSVSGLSKRDGCVV